MSCILYVLYSNLIYFLVPIFLLHLGQKCEVSCIESMQKGIQTQQTTGGNTKQVMKRRTKNTAKPSSESFLTVLVLTSFPHSGHTTSIGLLFQLIFCFCFFESFAESATMTIFSPGSTLVPAGRAYTLPFSSFA